MRFIVASGVFILIFGVSDCFARDEMSNTPEPPTIVAPASSVKTTTEKKDSKRKPEEKSKSSGSGTSAATPTTPVKKKTTLVPATPSPAPETPIVSNTEKKKTVSNENVAAKPRVAPRSTTLMDPHSDKVTEKTEVKKDTKTKSEEKPKKKVEKGAVDRPADKLPEKNESEKKQSQESIAGKDKEKIKKNQIMPMGKKDSAEPPVVKKIEPEKKKNEVKEEQDPVELIKIGTNAISGKSGDLGKQKKKDCCDVSTTKDEKTPMPKQSTAETLFARKLQFDDPKTCKKPNKYYLEKLKSVPDVIRLPREDYADNAEIAPVCMQKVMDGFPDASIFYAVCKKNEGVASRGGRKSCMTPDYFYSVYNAFLDVTDCFDISQKGLLPKLSNESGMHLNTLGGGGDAGVGQLTKIAIEDSNDHWDTFKSMIADSSKESCKRISPLISKMGKATARNYSCNLIAPPENPLKNLYYAGIVTMRNRGMVDTQFDKLSITKLLKDGGLSSDDVKKLKETITMLGYNAGAESAAILLKSYLADLKKAKGKKFALTKDLFDFSKNANRTKKYSCSKAIKKFGIKKLSFPEYAMACQGAGTNGYLSKVYESKTTIDNEMGQDLCTDKNFLKL